MSNFPSKWLDFPSHKELRRLRRDYNDSFGLKFQIALSIITAIISFYLESYIKEMPVGWQVTLCGCLCFAILLIFIGPAIIGKIKLKYTGNEIIDGVDAVTLFDDEIVYGVLVACEFFNARTTIPNTELKQDLETFYNIEIQYYVGRSIVLLNKLHANSSIFGDGRNKISKTRVCNIISIIKVLIEKANIIIDPTTQTQFDDFCRSFQP